MTTLGSIHCAMGAVSRVWGVINAVKGATPTQSREWDVTCAQHSTGTSGLGRHVKGVTSAQTRVSRLRRRAKGVTSAQSRGPRAEEACQGCDQCTDKGQQTERACQGCDERTVKVPED